jgi:hypothetical protein
MREIRESGHGVPPRHRRKFLRYGGAVRSMTLTFDETQAVPREKRAQPDLGLGFELQE